MGMIAYLREVSESDLARLSEMDEENDLFRRGDAAVLSLEKSWHGLHYLLTGSAAEADEPLGFLMVGGQEVGEDMGYGPPRLLSADFVQQLNTALRGITEDQLWARFDAEQFEAEGIYPGVWDEPADELREEYVTYFHQLRDFVSRVAKAGGQMVVVLE